MSARILTVLCTAGLLAACATTAMHDAKPSAAIVAAVTDSSRPAADTANDDLRKPAETIAFVGIKPGDKVIEWLPGGGYFTRILSKTVGAKGVVYALSPAAAGGRDPGAAVAAIAASPGYGNVKVGVLDTAAKAPELADVVWTSRNYHDLHLRPNADLAPYNKLAFDSLKHGGIYLVLDHAAAPGSGAAGMQLHRIDPAIVKSEVLAAGFQFVGSSDLLHNPKDDLSARVFDGGIRGHTDQFILKFRKP